MYIALEFNAYRKSKTFTVLRICMFMGISIKKVFNFPHDPCCRLALGIVTNMTFYPNY